MPGPRTQSAALRWVQRAIRSGRFLVSQHFADQREDRGLELVDAENAIEHATGCSRYGNATPRHGGSCWRVYGPGIEIERIVVAVEAYRDSLGEQCILITIVDEDEE